NLRPFESQAAGVGIIGARKIAGTAMDCFKNGVTIFRDIHEPGGVDALLTHVGIANVVNATRSVLHERRAAIPVSTEEINTVTIAGIGLTENGFSNAFQLTGNGLAVGITQSAADTLNDQCLGRGNGIGHTIENAFRL